MNTRAILIISVLVFLTLTFGVFGYTQRIQAEVAATEAFNQKMAAEAAQAEAERQRIESEMQRVVADDTMEKYQSALQDIELLKKRCK
jgi:F0F1-type ATP synthase membrane subunit b/b'